VIGEETYVVRIIAKYRGAWVRRSGRHGGGRMEDGGLRMEGFGDGRASTWNETMMMVIWKMMIQYPRRGE